MFWLDNIERDQFEASRVSVKFETLKKFIGALTVFCLLSLAILHRAELSIWLPGGVLEDPVMFPVWWNSKGRFLTLSIIIELLHCLILFYYCLGLRDILTKRSLTFSGIVLFVVSLIAGFVLSYWICLVPEYSSCALMD